MKNVKIKITGTQGLDENTDTIEFFSNGSIEKTLDGYIIRYTEGEISGNKLTNTELVLGPENHAVISRTGETESKLIIDVGQRICCIYSIPQGSLTLGITGEEVKYHLTEQGGTVSLKYTIDSNMQLVSKNTVKIQIKEI